MSVVSNSIHLAINGWPADCLFPHVTCDSQQRRLVIIVVAHSDGDVKRCTSALSVPEDENRF